MHPDLQLLQWLAQLPPPVRQVVRRVRKARSPCLLCGGPQYAPSIFVPYDRAAWGITPGMEAACVYALCKGCVTLPDRADQVEAILWATRHQDLQRARASWN